MKGVIVLNADYSYLNVIPWEKALTLAIQGKVEVVKYSDKVVNSVKESFRVPSIVRIIKMIRKIFKNKVPYSKRNVFIRDNYNCQYCGKKCEKGTKPTIDHIMPASRGGKSTFDNCVCSCGPCNHTKGDKTPHEAHMFLKRQPYQPTISEFFRQHMKQLGVDKMLKELFE